MAGDDRQQRLIVLKDDYGMRTSWVTCEYLKDLLNSITFGGHRRFNVESFPFYRSCEQANDMSRGLPMFQRAKQWIVGPLYENEHRDVGVQYGRQQIYAMEHADHVQGVGITNICNMIDLVVHFFAAGGDDDDMSEPAEEDPPDAEEAPPAPEGNAPEASSPGGTGDPAEEGELSRGTPTGGTGDGGTGRLS